MAGAVSLCLFGGCPSSRSPAGPVILPATRYRLPLRARTIDTDGSGTASDEGIIFALYALLVPFDVRIPGVHSLNIEPPVIGRQSLRTSIGKCIFARVKAVIIGRTERITITAGLGGYVVL